MFMLIVTLLACGPATKNQATIKSDSTEIGLSKPAPQQKYVLASILNLRAEPGGEKVGKVSINSPVMVIDTKDEYSQIRIRNNKTGWVPSRFLSAEILTWDIAMRNYQQATDIKERLSWAERSAALDDNRTSLRALKDVYVELGNQEIIAKLDRKLAWPEALMLVGSHEQKPDLLVLEWPHHIGYHDLSGGMSYRNPAQIMAQYGLKIGAPVWVLPQHGAQVEGRLEAVEITLFNECGGTTGLVLLVKAALPDGQRAVAYSLSKGPASWDQPIIPDAAAENQAIATVTAQLEAEDWEFNAVSLQDFILVRAGRNAGDDEVFVDYNLVDYKVYPDGRIEKWREAIGWTSAIGYAVPLSTRDIDGDGVFDVVWEGECMMSLDDVTGNEHLSTSMLCCGC